MFGRSLSLSRKSKYKSQKSKVKSNIRYQIWLNIKFYHIQAIA
ncbi:hypothetical protein [Okeania sp. SIO2B3]|nr:hypothetical protein [Okeania sp. SIO2B3]